MYLQEAGAQIMSVFSNFGHKSHFRAEGRVIDWADHFFSAEQCKLFFSIWQWQVSVTMAGVYNMFRSRSIKVK